jgi:ABC-type multidrug transport system permease subunit
MKVILSILAGCLIAAGNFFALAYIVKGILKGGGGFRFGLLAAIKFLLLVTIFFVIIKWVPVNVIALLIGFTIALFLLLLLFAFRSHDSTIAR